MSVILGMENDYRVRREISSLDRVDKGISRPKARLPNIEPMPTEQRRS